MAASKQNPLPFDPNTQGPLPSLLIKHVERSNCRFGPITKRLWTIKYAFQDGTWVNLSSVICRWYYRIGDELIPHQGSLHDWIAMPEFFPKPRGLTLQEMSTVLRQMDEKPIGYVEGEDGIVRGVYAPPPPPPTPAPAAAPAPALVTRSDSGYGSMQNTPIIPPKILHNTRPTTPTVTLSENDLAALRAKSQPQLVDMSSPLAKEELELYWWAHCRNA